MKKTVMRLVSLLMVGALLVGCTSGTGGGAQTTATTSAPTTTTATTVMTATTTTAVPTTTTEVTTTAPTTSEGTAVTTKTTTTTTKTTTTTTTAIPQPRTKDLMATVSAKAVDTKAVDETFYKAYTQFALNFFKKSHTDDNVLVSPFSVEMVLAMLANGANGTTKAELETALGLPVDDLNKYLKDYMLGLPNGAKLANAIWFNNKATIKDSFLQTNADYYSAELYQSKFDGETIKDINGWVSKNTDGMIKKMVDSLDPAGVMVLVNTVFFDMRWETTYSERQVTDDVFTTDDGEKRAVEMMNETRNMVYIETEHETGFAKPYVDGYYNFVALLPSEGTSIEDYVRNLSTARVREFWEAGSTQVKTSIPKFTIEYEAEMDDVLDALGIHAMRDPFAADFNGIGKNLYVDEIKHKAKIEVDEVGTKAAASTSATIKAGSVMKPYTPPTVILNRPFVYMIVDNTTGLPIFIGSVTDIGK